MGGFLPDEPDGDYYQDPLVNAIKVGWRYLSRYAVRYALPVIKWALISVFAAILLFLVSAFAVVSWRMHESKKARPLVEAAYDGDTDQVRALLEQGADPNGRTFKGRSALSEAAVKGHTAIVELLLEHGAEPTGWAMERSRANGHEDTAKLIERHLAEEEAQDEAGQSK